MRDNGTTELPPAMFIELGIDQGAVTRAAKKATAANAAAARRRAADDSDDSDWDNYIIDDDSGNSADEEDIDVVTSDYTNWKKNKDSIGNVMEFVGFNLKTKFPQNICLMRDGSVVFCDSFIPAPLAEDDQRPLIAGYRFNQVCVKFYFYIVPYMAYTYE